MLNENIKNFRKQKGISQEELAIRLNVVRQTVSKWENGLSVPDSALLISLADELDTTVCALLGETVDESDADKLTVISEKLEAINLQLARKSANRKRYIRIALIILCTIIVAVFIVLAAINGSYMDWNFGDLESAIAGTLLHGFEFVFVRTAPIVFILSAIGIAVTFIKK